MRVKKIISLFLVLVLGIQILPLQQIAAWLFSNPMTEEVSQSIYPIKAKSAPEEEYPPCSFNEYGYAINRLLSASICNHPCDEALFLRHADDILTPPPNC